MSSCVFSQLTSSYITEINTHKSAKLSVLKPDQGIDHTRVSYLDIYTFTVSSATQVFF